MQDNAILNAIAKRSSIREYTGEVVSRDQLETIIKAGMAAPSAMNHQPWEFVAIDDRALLDKLGMSCPMPRCCTKRGLPSPSVETSKRLPCPLQFHLDTRLLCRDRKHPTRRRSPRPRRCLDCRRAERRPRRRRQRRPQTPR